MIVIAGLGNPGSEYEHTRHNAGFDTVDELAQRWNVTYWKDACGAKLATKTITLPSGTREEVVLMKPQSFMNLSGGPVLKALKEYGATPDDLIVIHDELDIPPASIRVKFGGGLAGHNGLKSIAAKTGTKDFNRVRIGIGRPPGKMPVADYVLSRPRKDDALDFEQACQRGADAVINLIDEGLAKTQQKFN